MNRHRTVTAVAASFTMAACGSSARATATDGGMHEAAPSVRDSGATRTADSSTLHDARPGQVDAGHANDASDTRGTCVTPCPSGYTCGTANGIAVCRAASGIPLFTHVFVILEENTSLTTLNAGMPRSLLKS